MAFFQGRGFGVQSPTDYSFVRDVIKERLPYYAYEDMRTLYPSIPRKKEMLCQLLFRIANYAQAETIVCTLDDEMIRSYLHAGCNKSKITAEATPDSKPSLWVLTAEEVGQLPLTHGPCSRSSTEGRFHIMIIEGIRRNRKAKRMWKAVMNDDRATITYDLYSIGIVFADSKRYKQHYTI